MAALLVMVRRGGATTTTLRGADNRRAWRCPVRRAAGVTRPEGRRSEKTDRHDLGMGEGLDLSGHDGPPREFFEAYDQVLTPLATVSSVLQLVARAEEAGLMTALRTPMTAADIAVGTGLREETVTALCRALVTLGVAESDGRTIALTAPWQALTDPRPGQWGFQPTSCTAQDRTPVRRMAGCLHGRSAEVHRYPQRHAGPDRCGVDRTVSCEDLVRTRIGAA